MIKWFIYILAFTLSVVGVELFRRWSLQNHLLDIPNDRSSHTKPTPRGGGLVIVLISLFFYTIYQVFYSEVFLWSYLVGAGLIAFISWLDDIKNLSIIWRFLIHILASMLVIYQIGYFEQVYILVYGQISLGFLGIFITSLWIVWLTNVYNFMDGIDGLAGLQAVTASIGWFFIGYFFGIEFYKFFGVIILLSCLGFLFYNWQPAKIFMGDVGSAFLGYTFAVIPLFAFVYDNESSFTKLSFVVGILFIWLFFIDATLTIIRRLLNGQKIWEAHRQHLYQILVINKFSHQFVTSLYGLLSFIILIGTIYFIVLYKLDIYIISLVVMVTVGLNIFVYKHKMLT